MVNAQKWLEENYPNEGRKKVKEIYLAEPNLKGEMDLSDFTHEDGVKVYISSQVDETNLVLKNQGENVEIILQNPQKYLQQKYPTKEEREQLIELDVSKKKLEGELDLSDFVNLEELIAEYNQLTNLKFSKNNKNIVKIEVFDNQLTSLEFLRTLPSPRKIKWLGFFKNHISLEDLEILTPFINCEMLSIGKNDIRGNLKSLRY